MLSHSNLVTWLSINVKIYSNANFFFLLGNGTPGRKRMTSFLFFFTRTLSSFSTKYDSKQLKITKYFSFLIHLTGPTAYNF